MKRRASRPLAPAHRRAPGSRVGSARLRWAGRVLATSRDAEARLESLLNLSDDWYWEQDREFRFLPRGAGVQEKAGVLWSSHVGRRRWELTAPNVTEAQWAAHRAQLLRHEPFSDFEYIRPRADGELQWVSSSGEPVFDRAGRFQGYRGVGRDITAVRLSQQSQALRGACAQALSSVLDPKEALGHVLEVFCEILGWDYGAFLRPDETDGCHFVEKTWYRPELSGSGFVRASDVRRESAGEGGLIRRVLATGEPVRISNLATRPDLRRGPAALALGLSGAFAFPVSIGTRILGVMEFFGRRLWQPDALLLDLANSVGQQIGQFLVHRQAEARYRELVELSPDGILIACDDAIVFANSAAARLLGAMSSTELLGRNLSDFLPPTERPHFREQLRMQRILRRAIPATETTWLRLDGQTCDVEYAGNYFVHEERPAVQLLVRDVTSRRQAQQEILRRAQLYAALSHTNGAIVHCRDAQSLFEKVCEIAVEFGGFTCASVRLVCPEGNHLRSVAGAGLFHEYLRERKGLQPPAPGSPTAIALQEGRASVCNDIGSVPVSGTWRETLVRAGFESCASYPLRNGNQVLGVLALYSHEHDFFDGDITSLVADMADNISHALGALEGEQQRRAAESALRENERALSTLLSNLPGMAYRARGDPHWSFEFASAGCRDLTGLAPDELLAKPDLWRDHLIHPKDREAVAARLARVDREQPRYTLEYRLVQGVQVRWVWEQGQGVYDASGRLVAREGIVEDISARVRAEQQLAGRQHQLELALETSGQGLWDWQIDRGQVYYDQTWTRLMGLPPEPVTASPKLWRDRVHPTDRHVVLGAMKALLRGETEEFAAEFRVVRPSGEMLWVSGHARVIKRNARGRPQRLIGTVQDITARRSAQERLVELAEYDVLTGLPNRSLFRDRLSQAIARARRSSGLLAVMFVDLDHFKEINDTLGHAAGDTVLKTTATRLREQFRQADTVARLGGDEFTVILENVATEAEVAAVADKICDALRLPIILNGGHQTVHASIGIALYPRDGTDMDTLVGVADLAMYDAKRLGGDGYHWHALPA